MVSLQIRDFHIAEREEDTSYYAGYVGEFQLSITPCFNFIGHFNVYLLMLYLAGSAFMLGRALTSIYWGMVADRYGRKPIIIIGSISVSVFDF